MPIRYDGDQSVTVTAGMLIVVHRACCVSGGLSGWNDGAMGLSKAFKAGRSRLNPCVVQPAMPVFQILCRSWWDSAERSWLDPKSRQQRCFVCWRCVENNGINGRGRLAKTGRSCTEIRCLQRRKIANTGIRRFNWQGQLPGTAHPMLGWRAACKCSVPSFKLGSDSDARLRPTMRTKSSERSWYFSGSFFLG